MSDGLTVTINGAQRSFPDLSSGAPVSSLIRELGFRDDRVAMERNGVIVPRATWTTELIFEDDRLEIVHFVGGGTVSGRAETL